MSMAILNIMVVFSFDIDSNYFEVQNK